MTQLVAPPTVQFRVNQEKRTVSGLVVPWNRIATDSNGRAKWRFAEGSLHTPDVSRVKLNVHHDRKVTVGVAIDLESRPDGLYGVFRVAEGEEGDRALRLAAERVLDGFSIEPAFGEGDDFETARGVHLVSSARLAAVALTPHPAYDDARVSEVRMSSVDTNAIREALRVTRESPTYNFSESAGPSLLKDAAAALGKAVEDRSGPVDRHDARVRLSRFSKELATFTTVDTTTGEDVIPPGYRTVAETVERGDRPLAEASVRQPLADGTPFTVPQIPDPESLTGDHTEESAPTEGTLTVSGETVTPSTKSGKLPLTRELVDSSQPQGDRLALAAIAESYNNDVEQLLYDVLNTAQGGDSPNSTSTGSAIVTDLPAALATFARARRRKARNVIADSTVAEALAGLDMDTWLVRGLEAIEVATIDFDTGSTDADLVILRSDLWLWESDRLEFRYGEKSGPEIIEVGIYGYAAGRLLNANGLHAIRWTAS